MTDRCSSTCLRRRDGRAAVWVVLALLVVGLLLTGYLLRGGEEPEPPPPAVGLDDVAEDLALLQQKFQAAVQNQRSLEPLLPEARALVERAPDVAAARITYAQLLHTAGRAEEAYAQFTQALEREPNQPEVHDVAASIALGLGRVDEARHHFEQAVSLDKQNPKYRLHLAAVLLRQDAFDQARNELLQALTLDSSLHRAHAMLADVYAQQNRVDQALNQVARAVEMVADGGEKVEKDREMYLRKQARLLRRANRAQEAVEVLQKLPVRRRMDPVVSEEIAAGWMLLGRPAQAAAHYEAILFNAPGTDWAAERAAHYHLQAGQLDRARQNLEKLEAINPHSPRVRELEASIAAAGE